MMLVVVADVVLRRTVGIPVRGSYDMVSIGLLVMTFFGIGPVVAQGKEIAIDLLDQILPPRWLRVLMSVAAALSLALFAYIGWAMRGQLVSTWKYGDRSLELGVPYWALWSVAFVGLAGILIACLSRVTHEATE